MKFKVTSSADKVMATIFWDSCGVILINYLERCVCGHTISADHSCSTLTRLREAIQRKRPGMLSECVIFLHENARPQRLKQRTDWCNRLGEKSRVTAIQPKFYTQ
ncbi:hypothetical protein TNIN_400811 [Trichonephila inaurata madagascariensis]|uniref:Uncharacterized protein n=1 Tax=Trichonephila inaurata madagascariensis TaxID=2747483 RepID=A0A8X7C543_9ARAC|nr:hypothetical protein TNIN_400811 [Trichonephila inaurata madagascariensis]